MRYLRERKEKYTFKDTTKAPKMTRSVDRIPEHSMTRWIDEYDTLQASKMQERYDRELEKKAQYRKDIWDCASRMMAEKR